VRVKGYQRTESKMVVNTDSTQLEIIKRERARKRQVESMERQIGSLRDQVTELKKIVEGLIRNV
jgi:predicted RNase H-like nuclease (RuvC/YqgF family)